MSKHRNESTGVVVSVDDSKDDRYTDGWVPADEADKSTSKRAASKKSEN